MVFGKVLKVHGTRNIYGLVALGALAGAVSGPIGCSDDAFTGCKASRTCPPKEGDSGASGEAGGGADTGGASGESSSGSSGLGGTSAAGSGGTNTSGMGGTSDMGGAGSGGDDTEPPVVVSFTPSDGDVDVERDVTVTAELSEPIDEATVTSSSVTLEGPYGEVSGTLSVDGSVISFVADRPLNVLATYTFMLGDTVADLAGNTLGRSEGAEYRVRDGRWGTPTHPLGTTVSRRCSRMTRNARGDIVLGMTHSPNAEAIYGAVYDAASDEWTNATELRRMVGVSHSVSGVGIDLDKRAVIAWGGSGAGSWSRFTGTAWNAAGEVPPSSSIAVTPSGVAMSAAPIPAPEIHTQTMNLFDGAVGPAETITISDQIFQPILVASLDRLALLGTRRTTEEQYPAQELYIVWKDASWGTPEPIATAPDISSFALDSDEAGNVIVVWRETDEVWSRVYERARDAWSGPQFVATTSTDGVVLTPGITAGNAIVAVNGRNPTDGMWAAIYESGVGWHQSSITRLDDRELYSIGLTIDAAGNALAVWGPELRYRRYVAGVGWQSASSLDANVDAGSISGAGAPDGSVLVVATDLEANPNGAPMAVRFE